MSKHMMGVAQAGVRRGFLDLTCPPGPALAMDREVYRRLGNWAYHELDRGTFNATYNAVVAPTVHPVEASGRHAIWYASSRGVRVG